ncbi:flagellar basal body stator protein MotB [Virgisporangium aliadipatigenens]|uniref:Flagellar basal body stator protein MotB n=1 Tax=Virgisporangium aliadipatigenens TaxID=741659 RepID=A0A8J3YS03_9ACTN|nr:flagellar motor protein MotB [Virgisporangium aliadipatigenens]GIJ48668.1 flagellar basal body stator protein MotB [Virgisporangium aliadipatigenens]
MSGGHGGGGGRRRKHHEEHEEHENHERWLVSYADMMTLLMVLFIVLFAMSQVDKAKFNQLRQSLSAGFGGESVAFQGRGEQVQEAQDSAPNPMEEVPKKQTVQDKELQEAVQNADRARQSQMAQHAEKEVENLEEIKKAILAALEAQGLADAVRFTIDERGLVVTIVTSGVVFEGDRAVLLAAGRQILDGVGPSIGAIPNRIQVDGHTNQLPIGTSNYPSGWELSSARASSVVRYLHERFGITNERLSATGFADTRPLLPASDPRAVTLNRRVEVVVLSTLPAEERALLPAAAGEN